MGVRIRFEIFFCSSFLQRFETNRWCPLPKLCPKIFDEVMIVVSCYWESFDGVWSVFVSFCRFTPDLSLFPAKMTLVTSWFCVIALVLLSGASAADTPLKILAIGDSITAGGGPPSGATEDAATYRHDLEALLESHGIPAEFVGDICQNCKISGGLWNERCDMGCKRGSEKDKFIAFW